MCSMSLSLPSLGVEQANKYLSIFDDLVAFRDSCHDELYFFDKLSDNELVKIKTLFDSEGENITFAYFVARRFIRLNANSRWPTYMCMSRIVQELIYNYPELYKRKLLRTSVNKAIKNKKTKEDVNTILTELPTLTKIGKYVSQYILSYNQNNIVTVRDTTQFMILYLYHRLASSNYIENNSRYGVLKQYNISWEDIKTLGLYMELASIQKLYNTILIPLDYTKIVFDCTKILNCVWQDYYEMQRKQLLYILNTALERKELLTICVSKDLTNWEMCLE